MDFNLELIFHNMPEEKTIRRHLEQAVERLDKKFEGIEACQISFDVPYHHRYPGNIYDFQIHIDIPGEKLTVSRGPSADGASADIFGLISEAFGEMERSLDVCSHAKEKVFDRNQRSILAPGASIKKDTHLYRRPLRPELLQQSPRT